MLRGDVVRWIQKIGLIFFTAVAIWALGLKYINPTADGDVYFHTAYGRVMWENKAISLDENQFTWVHFSNRGLYPAWIPQILFYWLYKLGGDDVLYIYSLRLLLLFGILIVFIAFIYDLRLKYSYLVLYILFSTLLLCRNGLMLKADMFSVLFFTILIATYLTVIRRRNTKLLWIVPPMFLVWANSHVGVVLGFFTLLVVLAVEVLFYRRRKIWFKLLIVTVLAFLAMGITPKGLYHWRMVRSQFIREAIGRIVSIKKDIDRPEKYIVAFRPLSRKLLVDYTRAVTLSSVLFLSLLGIYLWSVRRVWIQRGMREFLRLVPWDLIVLNLVFLKVTLSFARLTYTYGIVSGFSLLILLRRINKVLRKREWVFHLLETAAVIFVYLLADAVMNNVPRYHFVGDGPWVPVLEYKFMEEALPSGEYKVFNTYGVGSYLILKGYPRFKVFVDTRMGHYFMTYYNFVRGRYEQMEMSPEEIGEKADVALLSYRHWELLKWFLDNPTWKVVFWGPAGVVLVNKSKISNAKWHNPNWDLFKRYWLLHGRNPFMLVRFLLYTAHLGEAKRVLEIAYEKFPGWREWKDLWNTILIAETDPKFGYRTYIGALKDVASAPSVIRSTIMYLARKHVVDLFKSGEYSLALKWEHLIFRYATRMDISLFNQGVLCYALNRVKDARAYVAGSYNYNRFLPYSEFVNCLLFGENVEDCSRYEFGLWNEEESRWLRKKAKEEEKNGK